MRLNHPLRDQLRSSLLALSLGLFGLCVTGLCRPAAAADARGQATDPHTEKTPEPKTVKLSLEEVQTECTRMDKDIKKHLGTLAQKEVDYERLKKNAADRKEAHLKVREAIAAMLKAVETKDEKVLYDGKKYSLSELALRLESKVHDYENGKSVIKTQEQVLASKRQALELGRERISAMRDQKELLELRVTIAKLEARLEAGQVKPDATVEVDAARLRRFRELAEKLDGQFAEVEQIFELPKQADRQRKSIDEVIQAAKTALQADDNKDKPSDQ